MHWAWAWVWASREAMKIPHKNDTRRNRTRDLKIFSSMMSFLNSTELSHVKRRPTSNGTFPLALKSVLKDSMGFPEPLAGIFCHPSGTLGLELFKFGNYKLTFSSQAEPSERDVLGKNSSKVKSFT
jgi:hypothetical protein